MQVLTVDYRSPSAPELFSKSLKETGFAVLTEHPISPALINQAYEQWRNFFNSEQKHDYHYSKGGSQDGYLPGETAKGRQIADLKEFYHFYPTWGRIPPELKEVSFAAYQAMSALGMELLQWLENHLPPEVAKQLSMPLTKMSVDSPRTLLRILHYPPLQGVENKEAIRAAEHEDIDLITILPAATAAGLEVQDASGRWHVVECDPGMIVVNAGDMLQMCTQHYYKSTTHRVVNPSDTIQNESRYSMPLFVHPRDEVRLSENYTAKDYLFERLKELGLY